MPRLNITKAERWLTLYCSACGKALRLTAAGESILQSDAEDCACVWECCDATPSDGKLHPKHLTYRESTPEDIAELILEKTGPKMVEEVLEVTKENAKKLVWVFCGCGPDIKNVAPDLVDMIIRECWELQDGYGEPGFTPPQGYDWSGVRDSTGEAWRAMEFKVLEALETFRVEEVIYQIRR